MGRHSNHLTGSTGDPEFDQRIRALVSEWDGGSDHELTVEMIVTALRLASDSMPDGDMKLFNRSLKEMRAASTTFGDYEGIPRVAVFGSARTGRDEPEFQVAREFGRQMRQAGYMIITGGGDGIMGAAQEGAGREHSFGLNIRLPFEQQPNSTINGDPKLINFNYFFTRKLSFLKESHAVALCPGGFGTMDEGFEALTLMQTGKANILPLVLLDRKGGGYWNAWERFLRDQLLSQNLISEGDFHLFRVVDEVEQAVEEITGFYRHFHSYRWIGSRISMRIKKTLAPEKMAMLNETFSDLLVKGEITQRDALPAEKDEKQLLELPRLVFTPHRHKAGRLRQFIDAVNAIDLPR